MPRPNEEIHKLWEMSHRDFDQWRRENDLLHLLAFFQKVLPHFDVWQSTHNIDDAVFLAPTEPSRFFRGTERQFLVSSTGPDYDLGGALVESAYFHKRPLNQRLDEEWQFREFGEIRYRTNWEHSFVPYFQWLRRAKGVRSFSVPGHGNDFARDFEYGRWDAVNTIYSRASLFHSHQVLKLGGVRIDARHFDNRNLDFVDLDHLMVSGRGGSRETRIAYASCRGLTFKNYDKPFVRFERSPLETPRFENCHLERFKFIESGLSRPVFRNARLARCELRRSVMGEATFEQCDLIDLKVSAPDRASAEALADFYKRLRVVFQSQGDRSEASRFFYQERFQRLRGNASPLMPRSVKGLPGLVYADSLFSLYEHWQRGQMGVKRIASLLGTNIFRTFITLVYPPYLLRFVRAKAVVIPEAFDWALWGFGEKPARVFFWMLAVLGGFTFGNYRSQTQQLRGNLFASLSCSTSNFVGLGCEHHGQFDSIQGLLGVILLGIMVAGFANRTRY